MGNHAEVVAAVLGPHGFAGALNGRIFLAVADHFKLAGVHAQGDQVFIGGAGAAFAEGQVVVW